MASQAVNIAVSLLLLLLCLLCNALLLILFLRPNWYHLSSLLFPGTGRLKPTVAATLIDALYTAVTAALVTRQVEHSLWLKLTPKNVKKRMNVGETHHLAQWCVSPLERIVYLFAGHSWLLKFGGLLLLGLAALNPVIVQGISQQETTTTSQTSLPAQGSHYAGFLDSANDAYNGGNYRDIPGTIAALSSMSNQSAPAASVCEGNPLCSVNATSGAFQATCAASMSANPNGIGLETISTTSSQSFCSSINPDICTTLVSSSPYTYANFSGGYLPGCETYDGPCPSGSWAVIFGVWINDNEQYTTDHHINEVDCSVSFGTAQITQTGGKTPALLPGSFTVSPGQIDDSYPDIIPLHRIYTEDSASQSPFTFPAAAVGTGANSLFNNPVATLLLDGADSTASAASVAARIEAAFEMGTLLAFSRAPSAADLTLTQQTRTQIYVYDRNVLYVLILPFLALLLGVWGRWRVGSEEEVVGYDPVEIASRGPVVGLPRGGKGKVEQYVVWGWIDGQGGTNVCRLRVGEEEGSGGVRK